MSLLRKIETDTAALMSYGRQFHVAGAAQRKARDPIFVWMNTVRVACHRLKSPRRKIFLVIRDLRYVNSQCRYSDAWSFSAILDFKMADVGYFGLIPTTQLMLYSTFRNKRPFPSYSKFFLSLYHKPKQPISVLISSFRPSKFTLTLIS